jgi:hypothetical protein
LIRVILRSLVNIVAGKDLISVGTQFKGTDSLRVSDTSLNVVMQNIGKSPATEAIRKAQFEGTLVKAVAYVDKSSGNLMIVPVNVPNPTK